MEDGVVLSFAQCRRRVEELENENKNLKYRLELMGKAHSSGK